MGARAFVQDTSTLPEYNPAVDKAFKKENAPRLFALLEAALESASYQDEMARLESHVRAGLGLLRDYPAHEEAPTSPSPEGTEPAAKEDSSPDESEAAGKRPPRVVRGRCCGPAVLPPS